MSHSGVQAQREDDRAKTPPVVLIAVERDEGARIKGLLDDAQNRRYALGRALWQAEPPLPVVWLNESGLVTGLDGQAGYASTLY